MDNPQCVPEYRKGTAEISSPGARQHPSATVPLCATVIALSTGGKARSGSGGKTDTAGIAHAGRQCPVRTAG
ncbi:hypothetical protein I6I68_10435 [Corynebacterium glucuronolyticum]|nr:hypothetical protein I6I68_10435 [Corynebacterium glucuronolyticum]